ncbi:MAG TPA: transcription termination factor NusA [Candidatus Moranbacteria bacterium]|nr:transcription termination factor NusA [Candidatus Moranbacteria bacterium]
MPRKKLPKDDQNAAGRMGDFGSAISALCEEKGISKEKVIETIEAALSAAYKKDYGRKGQNIKAIFDEVTGGTQFFLVKEVVDETVREFLEEEETIEGKKDAKKTAKKEKETISENLESSEEKLPRFNPERDLTLEEAKELKKGAKVGDIIETELETKKDYGRVAAQTAKQVIIQRIREAERDAMYDEYKSREGEVVSGVVQRIEGRNVFVDLGKSIGVLFPGEQMERENYRIGQRIKVYLMKVDAGSKGPGITLSRIHPEMIRKMFELEVPEIFAGTVELKAIAREAGERTKIAVSSTEEGIDPIGSCVGQKGTRVQAVIDELGGEKIDIILWNDDIAKFISAALSPAKVLRVDINEERKEAIVIVPEDQLSLAIGKRGQNVRLAAKLTGWKIDISGVKADGEKVAPEEKNAKKPEKEAKEEEIKEEADTEEKTEEINEAVEE